MSERLKAMRRIVALQAQQKRLAEWKLAAAAQRQAAIEEAQRDLAGFVDGGDLVGRLAGEAILQGQRLARRAAQADAERRVEAEALREAERRLKLSERSATRLAAEDRAHAERRLLEELIDALAARPPPTAS